MTGQFVQRNTLQDRTREGIKVGGGSVAMKPWPCGHHRVRIRAEQTVVAGLVSILDPGHLEPLHSNNLGQ